ncbi:MAG: hypothetical protein K2G25_00665 [Oscillospiraceae bacterium]|nr:hypothetical protein [Oscillospiraceae bacterium]
MSAEMKKNLTISQSAVKDIESRINELSAQGVSATSVASGELNISGCASGYCQAWA